MTVEQHLLFAVLALEDDLIDLQQLTAACHAWAVDKSQPLADLLVERGWVTTEHRRSLEEKAERKLARHQNDPRATLNQVMRADVCESLKKEVDDSDVRQSLSSWPLDAPVLIETVGETLDESQQPKTRYTWISEVAEGGLGRVWLARDNDLSREVALKEIKPGSASSEAVRRLIKEAQITGQLQHPGIVPVYEVNHEGRPYYTMKLVRGETLSQAIREHHEQKQSGKEGPVSKRRLLNVFLNVCEAIAYAHSRGVIHRDLKPENIVLGEYGEAIVLDWGLARQVRSNDEDLAPIVVTEDGHTDATRAGRQLGTPAYMAPEQASGRIEHMDERTDIYGLGAILFEILTGQAPHQTDKSDDVTSRMAALLHRIATGDTPRVRSIDETTPDELDAICAMAMAKHRDERYQTARDFKAALLEFQVHEESIELASRADDALAAANQSGNYDDFNRARFGFETALEQWPENARAVDGLSETRRDYSQLAFGRGDFELALSLLDAADPDQARLVAPIQAADEERSSREVRVRRLRRFGIAATLTIAMLASVAAVWINAERTIALNAQQEEATQRGIAEKNEKDAKEQRRMAQSALGEARLAESKARLAEADARREADIARRNLKLAERNAYSSDMLLSYRDWDDRALIQLGERLDRYRDRDELQGFEWHYLYRNAHRDVLTIGTQEVDLMRIGYYEDASFSPDGALIATCGTDRVVTLWNAEDGSVVAVLRGHEGRVTSVAFSADGSMIASASEDETIKLWDVASLMETETIHGHKGAVFCVCFNADGTQLASAGLDTTVKLWSTAGELVSTLNGHQGMVFSVDFSHDGQSIASAGADAVVRLWNSSTGQETAMLRGHTGPVQCVKFSTDGKRLVSASSDRTLKLWDVKSARELHTFEGHSDAVRSVAFAPDELRIVSGSDDHTARIWNTATGRERATLEGHAGSVDAVSVSPDGLRIVSASGDRTIKLWSIGTGSSVATFNGHKAAVLSVAFSPAGNEIASGGFDGTIRLWHLPLNQEIAVLKGHINRVRSVVFNRDGSRIVSGSEDRTVRIWDIPNGGDSIDFLGHTDWILQVAISPDGSRIGSASMDGTARVWNSQNQKELFAFDGSPTRQGKLQPVNAIVFSPDGRTVAFGSGRAVVLRDAITGLKIGDLTGHTNTVVSLAFSADGTILASGSMDTTVRLWELATGKEVARLVDRAGYSRSVAISPDSSRLITSNAGEVRMWDMETNREVATFTGHRLNVASVAFSPGGLRIASASMDGTVKVWDARPWTPELRAESQAQGYLAVHSEHVESFEELQAVIRADETITESVRKRALDWAELFWKNREPDRN